MFCLSGRFRESPSTSNELFSLSAMATQDTETIMRPSKRCKSGQFMHSSTAKNYNGLLGTHRSRGA